MREYRDKVVQEITACTCDRCGRHMTPDDPEWHERVSLDGVGGYDSVFGDGARISIDLCQRCLRDTLGLWLRVTPGPADGACLERLQRPMARTSLCEEPAAGEDDLLYEAAPQTAAPSGEPGTLEESFAAGRRIARAADRGETIPEAFRIMVEDPMDLARYIAGQKEIARYHGKLNWQGDLDAVRRDDD